MTAPFSSSTLKSAAGVRLAMTTLTMTSAPAASSGNSEGVGVSITRDYLSAKLGRKVLSFGSPKILAPNENFPQWRLWLHYRDHTIPDDVVHGSTGHILHATSSDGLGDWVVHPNSPVLSPSKEKGDWFFFDSEHVGLGDVIHPGMEAQSHLLMPSSVLLMYTFGGNGHVRDVKGRDGEQRKMKGGKMEIGLAVSQDGAHWSRVEGPSAYGSVLEVSKEVDAFDSHSVAWPSVVEVGKNYWMYYQAVDPVTRKSVIGAAMAKDGLLRWNKQGLVLRGEEKDVNAFDHGGITRRQVLLPNDGFFRMYYEAVSASGEHSIGLATSKDGLNWKKSGQVFAKNADANAWDGGGVGSPHLVWLPNLQRWRLYYMGYMTKSGQASSERGLADGAMGVAISTDASGTVFTRSI
eukprot:gene1545-1683_t